MPNKYRRSGSAGSRSGTDGLILQPALRREESRGAHFREDYPAQDDQNWRGHLQVRLAADGKLIYRFQPVKTQNQPQQKDL